MRRSLGRSRHGALRRILVGEQSDSISSDIRLAATKGSQWGIIRSLESVDPLDPVVHFNSGPVSAFIPLQRIREIYGDIHRACQVAFEEEALEGQIRLVAQ